MNFIILFFPLFFSFCEASPPYGQLSVKDSQLLGSNGQPAQLVGMSLFWSNCDEGKVFYNYDTLKILKCNWNANVVRAAMGVESSGCQRPAYLDVPSTERDKVEAVVKAAIELDMYVIIDFHTNNAPNYLDKAIEFFTYFAKNYGSKYPNILYETFNEALQVDWSGVKAYHEKVVTAIRQYDKNNIIILGTTTWSQDVDIATNNPVAGSNLCYTLHFYAASHKQEIRDKAQTAINNKNCVFVTEYGTVYNSGGGDPDVQSTNEWWSFLDKNKISYLNWALENKGEGSAALLPNTVASLAGDDTHLTASGRMVKTKLRSMNTGVSCSGGSNNGSPSLSDNKNGGTLLTTRVPANNNGIKDGDNKGYPEGKQVNNPVTSKPPSNDNNKGKGDNKGYPEGKQVNNPVTSKPPSNDNNKGKGYPEGNPKITLTTKLPGKKHGNGEQYPGDNNEPKHPNANSPATLKPKNDEGDDEECVCEDDENPNNGTNSVTKTPENNGGNFPGNNDPINCSIELRDKWTGGANLILNFVNNGNSKACAIKFTLELCPDQTIQSIWNVQKISENTYLLPNYIIIQPKSKYVEAGLVVNGPSTLPKIKFIEQGKCIY